MSSLATSGKSKVATIDRPSVDSRKDELTGEAKREISWPRLNKTDGNCYMDFFFFNDLVPDVG